MNGKFASINISVYKLHKNLNLSPTFCYDFIIKPHYKKTQKNTEGKVQIALSKKVHLSEILRQAFCCESCGFAL